MKPQTCPKCGKQVKNLRTTHGARIMLDPRPTQTGSYRLTSRWNFALAARETLAAPLQRHEREVARENGMKIFSPHLAVCIGPAKARRMVKEVG